MGDRRYPRPRSPPLFNPGRSSLPALGYNYGDLHAIPTRREVIPTSRSSGDRASISGPGPVTIYKIKPDGTPHIRSASRTRRSTLDSSSRPLIVSTSGPRRPFVHPGSARPASPIQIPFRSADDDSVYYAVPASSGRQRGTRSGYSATMDNADMNRLAREKVRDRQLRVGGREGAMYPRARPAYPGGMARQVNTMGEDYGDNGYGYTNPRDLVLSDLNRTARYPAPRRDSYEGPRPGRASSIVGYADIMPRPYEPRERGPPPSMRGFEKIAARSPLYDAPPTRLPMPPGDLPQRTARADPIYEPEISRRNSTSRRPVSVYHERERQRAPRDEYSDARDDELRDKREKPRRAERNDDEFGPRGYGLRNERKEKEDEERDYDTKVDFERRNEYDRRSDQDRRNEPEERGDRKNGRESLATGLSLAGAALGIGTAAKISRDDEREDREEARRKRDVADDGRRRRGERDDREPVNLSGREPRERHLSRDDRDAFENDAEKREKSKGDKDPILDLGGRTSQEKVATKGSPVEEPIDPDQRPKHRKDSKVNGTQPESHSSSASSDEMDGNRRSRRHHVARSVPSVPFNPKDTMDLRVLKEELNKQDANSTAPPILAKESLRDTSEQNNSRGIVDNTVESMEREDRGRRDTSGSDRSEKRKSSLRVVSPPREENRKPDDKPVKSILRQPREKFPEDPAPIREGVAPLKDAKKDGVPPDARWTKISRKLVNPDALEIGKERYEAREDFVIVLRVLNKEEVQAYATATQQIRAAREEEDEREERHRRRRERHEHHRHERHRREDEHEHSYDHEHRRYRKERDSHSESDTTPDDDEAPQKLLDAPKSRRITFDEGAGPGIANTGSDSGLREDLAKPGTYTGYTRNPPRKERA